MRTLSFALVLLLPVAGGADSPPVTWSPATEAASTEAAMPVPASIGEPYIGSVATEEPPICEANDSATAAAVLQGSRAIEAVAEKMRAEFEAGEDPPILLNNRGYGYEIQQRPDPAQLLQILEREARAAQ